MSSVEISIQTQSLSSNSQQLSNERCLSTNERILKLVQAVALVILSAGIALFFSSVRQMLKGAWEGKKIEHSINRAEDFALNTFELTDINLSFSELENETQNLIIRFTNEPTHRFLDILCPERTAFKVGESTIHGNWVSMPDGNTYIATQAPVSTDFEIFWKGVAENNGLIIDLTTPRDLIAPYAPVIDRTGKYGSCEVKLVEQSTLFENVSLEKYVVTVNGEETIAERVHYSGWKDHDGTDVQTLILLTEFIQQQQKIGKIPIIHCRAGVGRTGTLITVTALRNLLKNGVLTKDNIDENIKAVIMKGRRDRGPYFVQSPRQFNAIKNFLVA